MPVSAVDCVQAALQHTREQLFRPFRFGQWSRLALVGILAAELHSTSCHFNGINLPFPQQRRQGFVATPFPHLDPSRMAELAGVFIAAMVLAFILFFVFLYIGSVFRFILFDSVIKKHCSISEGWSRWHRTGRRYFVWQLVFVIFELLVLGVVIGGPLALAAALGWFHNAGEHVVRSVLGVILLIGLFLLFLLLAVVVQLLAKDFLVPIMALEEVDFADGWSRLMAMIKPEPGKYAVYLLLKFVLAIAAAIIFGILILVPIIAIVAPVLLGVFAGYKAGMVWNVSTVSLAIIVGSVLVAILIYLVALVNVPATVFFPAFSIYFFASRYPKLDALLNPAPPAPVLPPLTESPPPFETPPLPPSPEPV